MLAAPQCILLANSTTKDWSKQRIRKEHSPPTHCIDYKYNRIIIHMMKTSLLLLLVSSATANFEEEVRNGFVPSYASRRCLFFDLSEGYGRKREWLLVFVSVNLLTMNPMRAMPGFEEGHCHWDVSHWRDVVRKYSTNKRMGSTLPIEWRCAWSHVESSSTHKKEEMIQVFDGA